MNVLSLFDGCSCCQLALSRAGIKVDNYYASEIDKHAIAVTMHNFPNTIQLGDIRGVKASDLPKIDLLMGGSPCQGFSNSGKGLNFDDPRSKLFFEYVRVLKELREINPEIKFLLENVKMKKAWANIISEILGAEPVEINSALVSAQNRKRLYWANFPISQPKDKGITWRDVREHGVNHFYYTDKGIDWMARHSHRKNKPLRVFEDKAQMVEASHHKNYSSQRFFGIPDNPSIASMRGRHIVDGRRVDIKGADTEQYIEFRYDGKSNCLTTVGKDNIEVPFTLPNRIPVGEFMFRYITPVECERLQTMPDGYTEGVSNSQRYKMIGNGWTIDVIAEILKGMPCG